MRAFIIAMLLTSPALADEQLSIVEQKAIEAVQKEMTDVVSEIRRIHGMKPGDTWDAQGRIVRAPTVDQHGGTVTTRAPAGQAVRAKAQSRK